MRNALYLVRGVLAFTDLTVHSPSRMLLVMCMLVAPTPPPPHYLLVEDLMTLNTHQINYTPVVIFSTYTRFPCFPVWFI